MAYFIKYNDIDLTDKVKVRTVETTLTPPRENSTINIWERAGEIYNDYRWNNREITVSFLLMYTEDEYDNNPLIVEQGMADIKSCFNVDSPRELYLNNPDKFIYAIPDGDIEVSELRYNCVEITVNFICYDPFYYSEEAKKYSGTTKVVANNEGDVPTDPIIVIGVDSDCHFVQLENMANHKKMLIGNFPVVSKPSVSEKTNVIMDSIPNTSKWTTGSTSVDSGRGVGGTLGMTSNSSGLMCSDFGSAGSTTWHGVSARRNLDRSIKNFQVEGFINMISGGTNGDPSKGVDMTAPEKKYESSTTTSGTRTYKYTVTCDTLNVRYGPGTNYKVVDTKKKGDVITPTEFNGSWGKIGTNQWVNCSKAYVQTTVVDSTELTATTGGNTVNVRNYYTVSSAEIRKEAKKESRLQCTVPAGEIVRIAEKRIYDGNDNYYYHLEQAWHGKGGYIEGDKIALAKNVSIEYPSEIETADDKTGTIELYGYDANGVQLFKMSMTDDNEYYEFNYPNTTVGGETFLADTSIAPEPKSVTSNTSATSNKLTVTKDYILSGRYGSWNNFRGKFGIKRVNGSWQAWYVKMNEGEVVKQTFSADRKITGSPQGNLAYLVLYMGTSGDKPSAMSLERLEVKNLTPGEPAEQNIKKFQAGDVIKVDCYNNRVWLNNKLYNNVEIGSQFFPLEVGENTIRIISDKTTHGSVIFNEKYL